MSTSAAAAASAPAVASASSVSRTTSSAPAGTSALQAARVAAGADHAARAEPPGHLHRHRAGVAGRAEDEYALTRLERHPAAQRDPRRHRRIHRGGDLGHVGARGQLDRAARVDERLVRHRADDVVVGREVDEPAVGQPAHAVDPRDHRQRAAARVVPSRGAAADTRVQARGEDIGEHLACPTARAPRTAGSAAARRTTSRRPRSSWPWLSSLPRSIVISLCHVPI